MEPALKQRLIGALVISALAIVFLPRFIVGHDKDSPAADVSLQMPGATDRNFETRELPLTTPGTTPPGGVVGMDANARPLPSPVPMDADGNPLPADAAVQADLPATASGDQGATPSAAAADASATPTTMPTTATPSSTVPVGGAAATAAATDAAISAAQAGGNYVVSAGIYSNNANAQSLMNSLKAAHLPAYTESVSLNGKPGTRVRIGPFAQRGDAEAARLRAQQVRGDMTTSVTALDSATEAPAQPPVSAAPAATKPATAPAKTGVAVAAVPTTALPASAKPMAHATVVPPVAKPTTAAPAAPATAGQGFVVQVSAFRAEEDALAMRNRLRAAGFNAYSERVQADSGTLYRVRVGPAADRTAADQMLASLAQKLGLKGMVVAFP